MDGLMNPGVGIQGPPQQRKPIALARPDSFRKTGDVPVEQFNPQAPMAGPGGEMLAPHPMNPTQAQVQARQAYPQIGLAAAPSQGNRVGLARPGMDPHVASNAQPSQFQTHGEMRQAMLGHLGSQMQAAHASGDHAALYDLFAQRAALDNGGFQGHAKYMQDRELHGATIEKLNAGSDKLLRDPKTGETDPEKVAAKHLATTGDQAGSDQIRLNLQIANARARAAASGRPMHVPSDWAKEIINQGNSNVAKLFKVDDKGVPELGLSDLYTQLKAVAPQLLDDPTSEFSQATLHMIRQNYQTDLDAQLHVPVNPSGPTDAFTSPTSEGPIMDTLGWIAANDTNIRNGGLSHFALNPQAFHDQRLQSAAWFNRLSRGAQMMQPSAQ